LNYLVDLEMHRSQFDGVRQDPKRDHAPTQGITRSRSGIYFYCPIITIILEYTCIAGTTALFLKEVSRVVHTVLELKLRTSL
jgi:hypothetical protein